MDVVSVLKSNWSLVFISTVETRCSKLQRRLGFLFCAEWEKIKLNLKLFKSNQRSCAACWLFPLFIYHNSHTALVITSCVRAYEKKIKFRYIYLLTERPSNLTQSSSIQSPLFSRCFSPHIYLIVFFLTHTDYWFIHRVLHPRRRLVSHLAAGRTDYTVL